MRLLLYTSVIIILACESFINFSKASYFASVAHTQNAPRSIEKELSYPCELHECGCTKETCFADCCCKKTVDINANDCHTDQPKSVLNSIAKKVICKEKYIEKILILLTENKLLPPLFYYEKTEPIKHEAFYTIELNTEYHKIFSQFYNLPLSPPPKYS